MLNDQKDQDNFFFYLGKLKKRRPEAIYIYIYKCKLLLAFNSKKTLSHSSPVSSKLTQRHPQPVGHSDSSFHHWLEHLACMMC